MSHILRLSESSPCRGKLYRFHFDLVYTTRTTVSSCSGPRPTVVLSTRYKLEDDNETSDVYSEWAPMQVYSAGIKLWFTLR